MIVSQEENSYMNGGVSSESDGAADNPTDKLLIQKYEKYPEYLQLTFSKPEAYFDYLAPFSSANKESILNVLSHKTKETVLKLAFPLKFYI